MSQTRIIVGDNELALDPDVVIAATLQSFDFLRPGSVKASYTNSFQVDLANNRAALDFPDDLGSLSTKPYTQLSCKLLRSGLESIPSAVLEVDSIADGRATINVVSRAKAFLDAIKGKYLTDLVLTRGTWTNTDHDTVRAAASGLVCPVLDGGQLTGAGNNNTHGIAVLPAFYYATIMDAIFTLAGYSKSGTVFSDALYTSLVMPCGLTYDKDWLKRKEFSALADGTQTVAAMGIGTSFDVIFQTVQFNGLDNFYNASTGLWTVANADTALDYVPMGFARSVNITVSGGTVNVLLTKNGVTLSSDLGVGTGVYVGDTIQAGYGPTKGFKNGDVVKVVIQRATGTPTVTVNAGSSFNGIAFISSDTVKAFETTWYHYFEKLLPKIELSTFIQEFMILFGQVMKEKDGTVYFESIDTIINNYAGTLDWTNKAVDNEDPKSNFRLSGLAQTNYYRWDKDDFITSDLGIGKFIVANTRLPKETDILSSSFLATNTALVASVFCASFKFYDSGASSFTDISKIGARLLLVRGKYTAEPSVTFNVSARTDYKVAYFIDSQQGNTMDLNVMVNTRCKYYILSVQQYREIMQSFVLDAVDVELFDPFLPVWYKGQRWIVNKISNHVEAQPTKVELVKI